jgi:LysR family transcriptional regulator for bpeEF and oprC
MMNSDPNLNKGELTIFTTTSLIEDWIVPILPDFFEKYPSIHLNLISHDSLLTDDMKGRVISIVPKGVETDNIIQVPLRDFHVGLWAAPAYLERYGCPKKPSDLMRHRLLVFAKDFDKMTYPNINWHLKDLDIKSEDLVCINSSTALIKAARRGLGIISLSAEAVQASGQLLERVLPDFHGPTVTMCLTYPSHLQQNKLLQNVEAFLKKKFANHLKK